MPDRRIIREGCGGGGVNDILLIDLLVDVGPLSLVAFTFVVDRVAGNVLARTLDPVARRRDKVVRELLAELVCGVVFVIIYYYAITSMLLFNLAILFFCYFLLSPKHVFNFPHPRLPHMLQRLSSEIIERARGRRISVRCRTYRVVLRFYGDTHRRLRGRGWGWLIRAVIKEKAAGSAYFFTARAISYFTTDLLRVPFFLHPSF